MNPKELEATVKSNLSHGAKEMLAMAHSLAGLLEKSIKKPKDFTQEDWDNAIALVDRLNATCRD